MVHSEMDDDRFREEVWLMVAEFQREFFTKKEIAEALRVEAEADDIPPRFQDILHEVANELLGESERGTR